MSDADRRKWDARYAKTTDARQTPASFYLREQLGQFNVAPGRALDVACGTGRNSVFLAEQGYLVDAVDISAVGLERAAQRAADAGVQANWICQDLETQPLPEQNYALIIMFRYVAPILMPELARRLETGGTLIVEEHLQWHGSEPVAGPAHQRFRVAPGTLEETARSAGLTILHAFEGLTTGADGSNAAVAQITARRTAPGQV